MTKTKIFISYASEDRLLAEKIYFDLQERGFAPWIDSKDVLPGQNWRRETEVAIGHCDFFLALISSNSVSKRGFLQKEVKLALDMIEELPPGRTFVIPVRLDDSLPAYAKLRNLHWADLSRSYKAGIEGLIRTLEAAVRSPSSDDFGRALLGHYLTLIIPVRDKEDVILECLEALSELSAESVKIIAVDDSSDDSSWKLIQDYARGKPLIKARRNLKVSRRKIGAIETGLEETTTEYVVLIDADSFIEDPISSHRKMLARILTAETEIDALAFRVLPSDSGGFLGRMQHIEYSLATDSIRNLLGEVTCISGAGSLWRRRSLASLTEQHSGRFEGDDLELTVLAHANQMEIHHEASTLVRTQTPRRFREFLAQRIRWDAGLLRVISDPRKWKDMFLRPTMTAAIFRLMIFADIALHPFKILALLALPFILYSLPGHGLFSLEKEQWLIAWSSAWIAGVVSCCAFQGKWTDKAKLAALWSVYVISPLLFCLIEEGRLNPFDGTSVVQGDHCWALSPSSALLLSLGIPLQMALAVAVIWWLPVTFLLQRASVDRRGAGPWMALFPFYLLVKLLLLRTTSLIAWPFLLINRFSRWPSFALPATSLALLLLLFLPVLQSLGLGKKLPVDAKTWIKYMIKEQPNQSEEGTSIALIKSYEHGTEFFWSYDTSLAVISLVSTGEHSAARSLLSGLSALQSEDGSWRKSYPSDRLDKDHGDWRDIASNAWVLMAFSHYKEQTGDSSFEDEALRSLEWLVSRRAWVDSRGSRYLAMPENEAGGSPSAKATIATYAAVRRAEHGRSHSSRSAFAEGLRRYIEEIVWDDDIGAFVDPSADSNLGAANIDLQTWAIMALGDQGPAGQDYRRALSWCERNLHIELEIPIGGGIEDNLAGLKYSEETNFSIYTPGMLQLATAFALLGEDEQARQWTAKAAHLRTCRGGFFYAIGADVPGFRRLPAVSATSWYIIASGNPATNPLAPSQPDRSFESRASWSFDRDDEDWPTAGGNWRFDRGRLVQADDSSSGLHMFAFPGDAQHEDVAIKTVVQISPERSADEPSHIRSIAGAGIVFRYADPENFYTFRLAGEDLSVLGYISEGEWFDLELVHLRDFESDFHIGRANKLEVRVHGRHIACRVNGRLMIFVEDHEQLPGAVGLVTFKTGASFDDFEIAG